MRWVAGDLREARGTLSALNATGQPTRSRELALAVTNIEQGELWLAKALDDLAKDGAEKE